MNTIHLQDVVAMIPDGATLMIGGFMAVGTPERLMDELVRQGRRNLTVKLTIRQCPEEVSASWSAPG